MASLGEAVFNITAKDNFSDILNKLDKQINSQIGNLKSLGDTVAISGAAIAGAGLAMQEFAPGFGELGRIVTWFGALQTSVGGFLSVGSRMHTWVNNASVA